MEHGSSVIKNENNAADESPVVPHALASSIGRNRFAHIDGLRAVAVLLVVVAHSGAGAVVPGGSGVTVFFTISGFIITFLLLKERRRTGGFDLRGFYLRRLFKLAPPFLVLILVPTVIYSFVAPIDWFDVAGQVLFFFNWLYMTQDVTVLPGSGPVWSLSIEEQFYIVFALLWIFLVGRSRWRMFLTAIAGVAVVVPLILRTVLIASGEGHWRVYYGTDTRADAIAFGVLAALLLSGDFASTSLTRFRRWLSTDIALVLALFAFAASLVLRDEFFRETFRYSIQSMASVVFIVWGLERSSGFLRAVASALLDNRVAQIVGRSSYSIYLAHLSVFKLVEWLAPGMSGWALGVVGGVAGVAVGIIAWWSVEIPVERLKHKVMQGRQEASDRRGASVTRDA